MLSVLISLLAVAAPSADAGPPQPLVVSGALMRPGTIELSELKALGAEAATWRDHKGEHAVVGVRLDKVLVHFGFDPGPMGPDVPKSEKRSGWKKVVVASAPDGFQAVFSCAEISAQMGSTRALVIWEMDGKPLPASMGPLRLAVLTDQEPSRSLYQLSRLDVVDLRSGSTAAH
jgi:hypothetical protein